MAQSINLHIEVKIGDTWHHYQDASSFPANGSYQRDTRFLSLMGGFEPDSKHLSQTPIDKEKGMPSDASPVTMAAHQIHSNFSQCNPFPAYSMGAPQILKLSKALGADKYDKTLGFVFGTDFPNHPEDKPTFIEDIRFVFWFDLNIEQ